jgi:hypothetical protein
VEEIYYNKKEEEESKEEEKEDEFEEEEEAERKDTQTPSRFVQKNHPKHLILGDKNAKTQTRRKLTSRSGLINLSLLSKIDPKCFVESSIDQQWVNAMEDELNQIEKN